MRALQLLIQKGANPAYDGRRALEQGFAKDDECRLLLGSALHQWGVSRGRLLLLASEAGNVSQARRTLVRLHPAVPRPASRCTRAREAQTSSSECSTHLQSRASALLARQVRALHEQRADLLYHDERGFNALHHAAAAAHEELVLYLLQARGRTRQVGSSSTSLCRSRSGISIARCS